MLYHDCCTRKHTQRANRCCYSGTTKCSSISIAKNQEVIEERSVDLPEKEKFKRNKDVSQTMVFETDTAARRLDGELKTDIK